MNHGVNTINQETAIEYADEYLMRYSTAFGQLATGWKEFHKEKLWDEIYQQRLAELEQE